MRLYLKADTKAVSLSLPLLYLSTCFHVIFRSWVSLTPLTFNQTLMVLVNALQVMRKQQIENAVTASPSFPHAVRQGGKKKRSFKSIQQPLFGGRWQFCYIDSCFKTWDWEELL